MITQRAVHRVPRNHTNRIPRLHCVLDTEARSIKTGEIERQTWRVGSLILATFDERGWAASDHMTTTEPLELWEAIGEHTKSRQRTVVHAHNLAYDLRVSRAFTTLPKLGWALRDMNITSRASWCRWTRDGAGLTCVDTASVWPAPLGLLARDLLLAKTPLPDHDADAQAWERRCQTDVAILAAAVGEWLTWLREHDAGCWQMTGAGQAWSTWRHRRMPIQPVVHNDAGALAAERRAMWTGRAEAWRHGRWPRLGVDEWDLRRAYLRIAAECDLPVRFRGTLVRPSRDGLQRLWGRHRVLADVIVTTARPCVPTEHDGRTLWPVGTFRTTLWDAELDLLNTTGADWTPTRAWLYDRGPLLHEWARWLTHTLTHPAAQVKPIVRRALKSWSRSLIGRFALRYTEWERLAENAGDALRLSTLVDRRDGAVGKLMQIGGTALAAQGVNDANDSVPAVTSWIMSECRRRLWRLIPAIGEDKILYCDTDSLLVPTRHRALVERARTTTGDTNLRVKRTFTGLEIRAPRSLVVAGKMRVSGVPKSATPTTGGAAKGVVWQSLARSLETGQPDQVTITPWKWSIPTVDRRRRHLAGGRTEPYNVTQD